MPSTAFSSTRFERVTSAVAAGTAGEWIRRDGRVLRAERYVSGGVFVGLGVTAALAGDGRK